MMMADITNKVAIILVVEDEPLLRLAAVDLVEAAGYQAVAAADATEAVAILEERDDIRIVFTDVDMPRGLDGMRLAAIIRDRWPPIKVIVVSGHIQDPGDRIPAETVFFAKPYREEQIVETIKQLLQQKA
ncbi:response regulator [Agrobacterium deltaense]|uniref:response regulator n=1 Tax=Agrobacterium deltaense TaxID=1183412 RepID=UPI0009D10B4F|nr:response regulator [Agrobacterium deltaense]CUX36207.1 Histidine kinase/response regulator hybrid protein [Agrobacterium deltaense RV3]